MLNHQLDAELDGHGVGGVRGVPRPLFYKVNRQMSHLFEPEGHRLTAELLEALGLRDKAIGSLALVFPHGQLATATVTILLRTEEVVKIVEGIRSYRLMVEDETVDRPEPDGLDDPDDLGDWLRPDRN
jgi:hypothetical protein